jgi:co-chaperonin GroES (HSP10)
MEKYIIVSPIGARFLVQVFPNEPENKTASGLVLPDQRVRPPQYGKVIARGDKVTAPVEVGQVIFFSPNAFYGQQFMGTGAPVDFEEPKLVDESAVLAIVTGG